MRSPSWNAIRSCTSADDACLRGQALAICGSAANGHGGDFPAASLETLRQLIAAGLDLTPLPVLAIPVNQRELPGVAARPFAGTANRRIGPVCRTTYSHRNELDLLAELVVGHLPGVCARYGRAQINRLQVSLRL